MKEIELRNPHVARAAALLGGMQKLADALEMVPLNPSGKVTATTKIVQTLTGNLRYFIRAAAGELNVLTHRLSCVQASAPPEAIIVAKAAGRLLYRMSSAATLPLEAVHQSWLRKAS
jgi:hypothetical protein